MGQNVGWLMALNDHRRMWRGSGGIAGRRIRIERESESGSVATTTSRPESNPGGTRPLRFSSAPTSIPREGKTRRKAPPAEDGGMIIANRRSPGSPHESSLGLARALIMSGISVVPKAGGVAWMSPDKGGRKNGCRPTVQVGDSRP